MSNLGLFFISGNPDSIMLATDVCLGFDVLVCPDDIWQSSGKAALPGLSQCDVVLVEVHDFEPQMPGYDLSWEGALAQNKPIVLAAFRGGAPSTPAPLVHCPLIDVRTAVAEFESQGAPLTAEMSMLSAEFSRLREALTDAIENDVPADVADAILKPIEDAHANLASNDPAELVVLLNATADAVELAVQHNAKGLQAKARNAAHAVSSRIIRLQTADDAPQDLEDDLIDQWTAACDRADLASVATVVRLVHIAERLSDLDPEFVLQSLEERWTIMQQPNNEGDLSGNLLGLFGLILADLTTIQVNQLDDSSAREIVARLDRAAPLIRVTGPGEHYANLLCVAGQFYSRLPGGGLRAVRRFEEALQITTTEYPTETRGFVLRSAESVAGILEACADDSLKKNRVKDAWNFVGLLARLRRSLPNQSKFAESLACLAKVSTELPEEADIDKTATVLARHLASVYLRNDLADFLAELDSTDALITN